MAQIGTKKQSKNSTEFSCEKCNYVTVRKNNYAAHLLTAKHKRTNFGPPNQQKNSTDFRCEKCNYTAVRKNNYDAHLLTAKHKTAHISSNEHNCDNCNKIYQSLSGLRRHKKKCVDVPSAGAAVSSKDELIMTLIKQNSEQSRQNAELHEKIIELCKNGVVNTTINTNSNNTNNRFNLQFFLNETCKDAINLSDFAKSIVLQLTDIVDIGRVGYVNGMSNIIISKLNLLEENKRPIHCTDVKREVVYVKDEDKWEKDTSKKKMRILIKKMDRKLAPLMISYSNNHKKEYRSDTEIIKHQQVMYELVGGKNDESDNEDDIIRNISKKMVIARGQC